MLQSEHFFLHMDFLLKNIDLLVIFRVNRAASNEECGKLNVGLNITTRKIHFEVVNMEYHRIGLLLDCTKPFDVGGGC